MSKFPLIVFEGIDGSGKTHHINKIISYFKKQKIKYFILREPGGSKNSEIIRNLILKKKNEFNNETDLFLYMASRSENIALIKENLKKKIVLIDRFVDSTLAYQHYGMGINKKFIINLNRATLKKIKPSFTFLNIVNMKNLKFRLNKRKKNRYDKFSHSFYNKVQKGFIKLSKNNNKYMIINSNKSISENKRIILNKINSII